MTPLTSKSRAFRLGSLALVTVGALSAATMAAIASPQVSPAEAAAGTPGVPGQGTIIFAEDFENGNSATANPPKVITNYVGATNAMTYTASPYWSSAASCNGILTAPNSAGTASSTLCSSNSTIWDQLKALSGKLSNAFGDPGDNFTLASYTSGNGTAGEETQLSTNKSIPLGSGGGYLTASIDSGVNNCTLNDPTTRPLYELFLTPSGGSPTPVSSAEINPCADPNAIVDASDGKEALLVRSVGDSPLLVTTSAVDITLNNNNIIGKGNDATIDNLLLWDVSPQLDKVFEAPTGPLAAAITFYITNTYSPAGDGSFTVLDPKLGWSFKDNLPSGMTITGAPTTGTGATKCANFSPSGTTVATVSVKGDLVADQVYCTVTVPVSVAEAGNYVNLASDVTTVGIKPPADADITFEADPAITLDKTATYVDTNGDGVVNAGDTIAYSFVATNTGNTSLDKVEITDPVAGSVTCVPTSLAVGGVANCTADAPYSLTQADIDAGLKHNDATVDAVDPASGTAVNAKDSTDTPLGPNPVLDLVKAAGAPTDVNSSTLTDAGDTIAYTFTLTNKGNVTLSDVRIDDPLAGAVTCDPTTLAPGDSVVCNADAAYVITDVDEKAGAVTNTATAYGTTPGGVEVPSNTDTTTTPVQTPAPHLTLVKTAAAPVDVNFSTLTDAGDTIAYSFVVTNDGNVPLSDITVTDDLVGAVTCTPTALAVGESATCTPDADPDYEITEDDEVAGSVDNVATAAGVDPDKGAVTSAPDATSTPVDTPAPHLTLLKSADDPVDVNASGLTDAGDTIQYNFVVTNDGNVPLTNVAIADPKAGAASCDATELAVGASTNCAADAPYVITEDDETAGSADNVATATGSDPDGGDVESAPDDTSTPVSVPRPSLFLVKSADDPVDVNSSGLTDAGDTIAYTFEVTNNGNVPITDLAIEDPLVGDVKCDATELAVGDMTTCTALAVYVITEDDEVAGTVHNVAIATGLDPDEGEVASAPDDTTTPVDTPAPLLVLSKTAEAPVDVNGSGLTDATDTIQYTFVVTNRGNVPITDVAVVDAKAGAVTCEATTLAVGESTNCTADNPYVITEDDEKAGRADNVATATGADPDGGEVESDPDDTTTPVDRPDPNLTLVKTAGTPVDVNASGLTDTGDTIQYTFVVTNAGNVPLTAIAVSDPKAGAVTCDATELGVGESTDCTADKPYVITGDDEAAGRVDNVATATGKDPDAKSVDSTPAETSTPVAVPGPSLFLDKIASPPIDQNRSGLADAGDAIRYSFVITNNGDVTISGISIDDPLVGSVTCAATTLAPGESTDCAAEVDYTITADDQTRGSVDNVATAAGKDPDGGDVLSAPDQTSTPVETPAPELSLQKLAINSAGVPTTGPHVPGDKLKYKFIVTNTGTVTVFKIAISDPKIGAVTCEKTTLEVAESTTCASKNSYVVTQPDANAGSVTNTATATGVDPDGGAVASKPASAKVTTKQPPQVLPPPVTGGSVTGLLIAATLLGAGGLTLLVLARRRPRRATP